LTSALLGKLATEMLLRHLQSYNCKPGVDLSDDTMILKQILQLKCEDTNLPLINVNQYMALSSHFNDTPVPSEASVTELCIKADVAIMDRSYASLDNGKYIASSVALAYLRKCPEAAQWIFEDSTLQVDLNQSDEVRFCSDLALNFDNSLYSLIHLSNSTAIRFCIML
jgi:hypothetical protein